MKRTPENDFPAFPVKGGKYFREMAGNIFRIEFPKNQREIFSKDGISR
jgi:hypothetical protein